MTKTDDFIAKEKQYCAHNYDPLPVVLEKGKGVWVWDVEGKKYLDMLAGYSALSHGHLHPKIIKALKNQSERLTLSSRAFYSDTLGSFCEKICKLANMERVLPMNSGVEAVETALKAARRYGYQKMGIPEYEAEIIVTDRNFHGRTITVVSFSSEPSYKAGYGPFTPGFVNIPFGDLEALENAITDKTCAFLVEPYQGEGGIIMPPDGYLERAHAICKNKNILLMVDEIQVGLGRTGKLFAYQHDNIQPDGLILGKTLGGGAYPVSAFLANNEIMDVFNPGSHGSTFGGATLGAAVAEAAIDALLEDKLAERSCELGAYMMEELKRIADKPYIKEVRGKGLFIGMEFDHSARKFCELLKDEGILAKETHGKTVRFTPPLVIEKKEIDWALERIAKVLDSYPNPA